MAHEPSRYLLIESRDPHESGDVGPFIALAAELSAGPADVALLLVQNAVLSAREGYRLAALPQAGGRLRVLADDFSLRERGIAPADLRPGVEVTTIDRALDLLLEEGRKVIWH